MTCFKLQLLSGNGPDQIQETDMHNYFSLTIVTDPKAFDASFYGAGAPESFFTEHYSTYSKFIKAVRIIADKYPEARLQANVPLETLTEIESWFQGELYWRTSHDQTVFDKGEHLAFQRYSLIEDLREIEKDEEALDKGGLD